MVLAPVLCLTCTAHYLSLPKRKTVYGDPLTCLHVSYLVTSSLVLSSHGLSYLSGLVVFCCVLKCPFLPCFLSPFAQRLTSTRFLVSYENMSSMRIWQLGTDVCFMKGR